MTDAGTTEETTAPEEPVEPPTLHGAPMWESHGQTVVFPARDQYLPLLEALQAEGFAMCIDVCGIDYAAHLDRPLPPGVEPERFEVVVNLLSFDDKRRVRVRVQVPVDDPTVPSLFQLWPGTEAMERECWDMFGIAFSGHPDLTRILMPEDWEGHPLRKDYAIGRVPVQFKAPNQGGR